jgi:hypothetical protein
MSIVVPGAMPATACELIAGQAPWALLVSTLMWLVMNMAVGMTSWNYRTADDVGPALVQIDQRWFEAEREHML